MTLSSLLLFCGVYCLAAAAPGPGIAAIVARVLARGFKGTPAFILGFVVGDLIWLSVVATGLVMLAQSFEWLFMIIKYAGAAYLLFLAYKLWRTPAQPAEVASAKNDSERTYRLFLGGLALTLGNPKVIIFFVALLPTVIDLAALDFVDFIKLGLLIAVCLSSILSAYALTAAKARAMFANSKAIEVVNKCTGAVMAGAAMAVATR